MSIAKVNAKLKKLGLPMELVKGPGYYYFIYDDEAANIYETSSIMVYSFKEYTIDQWVAEGLFAFSELIEKRNNG